MPGGKADKVGEEGMDVVTDSGGGPGGQDQHGNGDADHSACRSLLDAGDQKGDAELASSPYGRANMVVV
ncbi:MAG: hypothetical protein ACRDZQ_16130, partial [Acidimicrobiales bacterium]